MKTAGVTDPKHIEDLVITACDATEAEDDPGHLVKMREAVGRVKGAFEDVLEKEKDEVRAKRFTKRRAKKAFSSNNSDIRLYLRM